MQLTLIIDTFELGTEYNQRSKDQKSGFVTFNGLGFEAVSDVSTNNRITPTDLAEQGAIHSPQTNSSNLITKFIDKTSHINRKRYVNTWGTEITPYRIWGTQSPKTFTAQFESRLKIMQDVANMVYYELYADGYGTIQYHPKRLAKNFLKYDVQYNAKNIVKHERIFPGVQMIGLEETLTSSSNVNVEELITHLKLIGKDPTIPGDVISYTGNLIGAARNVELMERFGYRRMEATNQMFNYNKVLPDKTTFMNAAANELLIFINSGLHTRTDNIVFRPEIDLACPVCILPDKEIFYSQSISHNITIGGDASTTINSNFGRSEHEPAPDLGSYIILSENLYKVNNSDIKGKEKAIWETNIQKQMKRYFDKLSAKAVKIFD